MEKNNNVVLILIIMVVTIIFLGGYIIYDKLLFNNSDSYNECEVENNKGVQNNIPKKDKTYFNDNFSALKYVPEDLSNIDNVTDEYITKFIINYYMLFDKESTINYNRDDNAANNKTDSFNVSIENVEDVIYKYFNIENKQLAESSYSLYDIKIEGDNYKISYVPTGYDIADEEISDIIYGENVTIIYDLINPYTQKKVGYKKLVLNYDDSNDKFYLSSVKYNITDSEWSN